MISVIESESVILQLMQILDTKTIVHLISEENAWVWVSTFYFNRSFFPKKNVCIEIHCSDLNKSILDPCAKVPRSDDVTCSDPQDQTTDAQWSLFSLKSRTFGLGQTNCADKFWGIWGIFGWSISTHFGTVSPLSIFFI